MKKKINLISFNLSEKNINFNNKINKKKNFLIGDWCRENKEKFNDSKDLPSLNDLYQKKLVISKKEIKFIESKKKKMHNLFYKNLNFIHGKNHKKKYWEFLLDRWLVMYIIAVYNHWVVVEEINKKKNIKDFYSLNLDDSSFIPETTLHYRRSSQVHAGYWSHWTFTKILRFKLKHLKETKVYFINKIDFKKSLLKFSKVFKNSVLNFSLKDRIFFQDFSLSKKIILDIFLKKKFFNFSYNYKEIQLDNNENNNHIRDLFFQRFKKTGHVFDDFLIKHMYYCFPKVYLENYALLDHESKKLNWPSKPKFILTSYGHYFNEMFKIYCAEKISKNSKLFIFQHGEGGIYANNDFFNIGFDKVLCDNFFTWGKLVKKKTRRFFYTKKGSIKNKKFFFLPNNKILLVCYGFQESLRSHANLFSFAKINKIIFKNIINFSASCKPSNILNSHIKTLDMTENKTFDEALKVKLTKLKLLDSRKKLQNIINNYNVIVHFYLSTPFFESLLFNRPTILIFNQNIQLKYDENFKKIIKKLFKNKIFFSSSKKAALFLNKNNNNLEKWWNSIDVQNLRIEICNNYCREYDSKSNDFRKMFK